MNKFSIFFLSLISMSLFSSCEKVSNTPEDITDEEVIDILSGALTSDTEGITAEAVEVAAVAESYESGNPNEPICGTLFDSTLTYNINTAQITANYTSSFGWTLECNNFGIPITLIWSSSTEGNYELNRLRSEDSGISNLTVNDLITGSNFVISGSYTREGTQESKIASMRSFASLTQLTLDELSISKMTQKVVSGSGTFLMTGTGSESGTFSVEGSIVFHGDGTATVTVNGNTYTITL